MFYFRFATQPKSAHPDYGRVAGAYVNCWILRDTQPQAESFARASITDKDWHITDMEAAFPITRETQDPQGMQYFEQAEIDREVFVFHTHSVGAQDDDAPTA